MLVMCTNRSGHTLYININQVVAIEEVPIYYNSEETEYVVACTNKERYIISDKDASKLVGKMHL